MNYLCGMKAKGYIVYEGPSMFDGSPIVGIVTLSSENIKTGPMHQLWILRSDVDPINSSKMAIDGAICGDCPLRRSSGGACYVTLFHGPSGVFKSYHKGIYTKLDVSEFNVFNGKVMRFGAYGDSAMLPREIVSALKDVVNDHTAYTHQFNRFDMRDVAMASVESIEEKERLNELGWRTFRVITPNESLAKNEIICPNYTHGTKCIDCGLCNGVKGVNDKRKNIAIPIHGALKSRVIKKINEVLI